MPLSYSCEEISIRHGIKLRCEPLMLALDEAHDNNLDTYLQLRGGWWMLVAWGHEGSLWQARVTELSDAENEELEKLFSERGVRP